MTSNVPPQLIQRLRELRPKGEDTPDEFIADILVACNFDLSRSFEMLEERLSRSSWEVEKGKKKKPEVKPNNPRRNHASVYAPRDRRFGAPSQHANPFNGKTGSAQPKPATAPPPQKPVEKPVEKPAPQPRPVDWVAPPPCNKWANGRPQLIADTAKAESKMVIPASQPAALSSEVTVQTVADTSAHLNGTVEESTVQASNLSDGSFESSSHTEDTVPSDSIHESIEEAKQAEVAQQPTEIEEHVAEEEVTAVVADVQDLKIDEALEKQGDAVPIQQSEQSSTEAADDGSIKAQLSASAGSAPTNHVNSGYPSYGAGYNQYGPPFASHQPRFARQDQSNVPNGSKFHGPSDFSPNAADDGRNPAHNKFPINPKMQHHQSAQGYGWQGMMGNSYGMVAPNMYSMSPQQMHMMMNMPAYGMGMPYGSNFTGMSPYAQQQNFTAASSKANQYQQTGAKQGMYNGTYSQSNSSGYSNAAAGYSNSAATFGSQGAAFVPATGYPASYGQGNAAGYQNIAGYNVGGYGAVSARGEDYTKRTANEGYSEGAGYGLMYSGMGYEQSPQGFPGSRGMTSGVTAAQESGGSYYWNPSYFQNSETEASPSQ